MVPIISSTIIKPIKPYIKNNYSNSLDADLDDYWKGFVKKKEEDTTNENNKDVAVGVDDDDDDDDDPVLIGL